MAVTVTSSSFNGSLQVSKSYSLQVSKSCSLQVSKNYTSNFWSQGSRGQELVAHAGQLTYQNDTK